MTSVLRLRELVDVVIGVDTHVQTHSAAAIDASNGAVLDQITVPATGEGYEELLDFADQISQDHAAMRAWAIEGTGSHGRGLSTRLRTGQELVIEVDRPHRPHRRGGVKSDHLDAVRAAREALTRPHLNTPRGAGLDEATAQLRQALTTRLAMRRSAVQAASDARRQLFSAVLTAPEPVRARLRGLSGTALITTAAALRTHAGWATTDLETTTTVTCLRTLARRIQSLTTEAAEHEHHLRDLVHTWRPDLLAQPGLGPTTAAIVLCAWSHPGRVHSEAAFAKLAGVSPIEATSGQIHTRHRLNRYGDRRLNSALHTIALVRQRHHQPTRAYTARRTTDGKTPREIRRCLKRYIIRDLYRLLESPPTLDAT